MSLTIPAVIPAHPLALDDGGAVDWRSQRALTRYYLAAGATGLAVGVHTTQFELHDDLALLADVWGAAADEARGHHVDLVAGISGDTPQAVREAERARELGYGAALVSGRGAEHLGLPALVDRMRAVGASLPVIGFYLQAAVGGRRLPASFWRDVFELESLLAVKLAPFDRYVTLEVMRVAAESGREDVTLLTGNDDLIVADLVTKFPALPGQSAAPVFSGGLLGQWAVGTRAAGELARTAMAERDAGSVTVDTLSRGAALTMVNEAVFDPGNQFSGAVAGINELLRQQGLLRSARCLSSREVLSPGQSEAIARARQEHPELLDEEFVAEHLDVWLS